MHRHTETEENYLKVIHKFSIEDELVSTTTIARELGTTPASVTDMLKRLGEKTLVEYVPYKGARLLENGKKVALDTIRKHRLWEVFLVQTLNFSWDNVHDTAEQLEHVDSPLLIDKLDEFLGFPKFDPHGDPIPTKDGKIAARVTQLLAESETGHVFEVVGVHEHSSEFLKYLDRLGVRIGSKVEIVERIEFDQSILLSLSGREIMLSGAFSKQIIVMKS